MSTEKSRSKSRDDSGQPTPERQHALDMEKHGREALTSLVREHVLHVLGEQRVLLAVQVRPLWGMNYRANVFVGVNAASARIIHSFFLVTDGNGNILESTPKMKRP
jgi:hypothetical protein